jgi:arginine decarboxylase
MGGKIVQTLNITQSAVGKKGKWTTVIPGGVYPTGKCARPSRR